MLQRAAFLLALMIALAIGADEGRAFEPVVHGHAVLEPTDCWAEVDGPTNCAWISVPERWDCLGGKSLRLPVVIYEARDPKPSLSPVIYLHGGPGEPALGSAGSRIQDWRLAVDLYFPGRSLVLFDQRGTGLGSPRLNCTELEDPLMYWPLSSDPTDFGDPAARRLAAVTACRTRLAATGHDLAAFTTRQNAADVEALRRALGAEKAVLLGISYGTRLALTVMRHYPQSVAATILDSVFPPQAPWPGADGEAFGGVLARLLSACAAHARCAAAYPDLEAQFLDLLTALERQPVILEIANLKGRAPLFARIDHLVFLDILRKEMYHTARLPDLPAMIAGLAKGRTGRLKPHAENVFYESRARDTDSGMFLSVSCHDKAGRTYRQSDVDGTGPYPFLAEFVAASRDPAECAQWPADAPDLGSGTPVESDIPSLLPAGALDSSTPLEWAESATASLSNAHLVVFPAVAHVPLFNSACARKVVQAFLANPQARPEPLCLASLRRPSFRTLGGG